MANIIAVLPSSLWIFGLAPFLSNKFIILISFLVMIVLIRIELPLLSMILGLAPHFISSLITSKSILLLIAIIKATLSLLSCILGSAPYSNNFNNTFLSW